MFDIGFWELSIIGVVALIVIGPERLPGVARTAGLWFGRMRRFITDVKADIDKELKAEELQNVLKSQADSTGIHEIFEETKEAVASLEKETKSAVNDIENEVENEFLVTNPDNEKGRYEELDDEDYFDDEPEPEPVAESEKKAVTETEQNENPQQDNDSKA